MESTAIAKPDLLTPSSIENVDSAIFDWASNELKLSCTTKDGFKPIPVLWVTPERAYQIKQNKEFRDYNGAIIPPFLSIERTSIMKDQKDRGTFYSSLKPNQDRFYVTKVINQDKTANFANADSLRKNKQVNFITSKSNKKIVYQHKSILLPVYVSFEYTFSFLTQYQQQMNELVQPFLTKTGSTRYFIIEKDGYKYECFIDSNISQENTVSNLELEERKYVSKIKIKVLANLNSDGINQDDSLVKIDENAVEIKLPKEKIILGIESERQQARIKKPGLPRTATEISATIPTKKIFLLGDGINTTYDVTHNLSTRDMYISIRENFGEFSIVTAGIVFADLNTITVDLGDIAAVDSYVLTIIG